MKGWENRLTMNAVSVHEDADPKETPVYMSGGKGRPTCVTVYVVMPDGTETAVYLPAGLLVEQVTEFVKEHDV